MNNPENIEEYQCLPSDVKMIVPLYNNNSGDFLGLEKGLAFIVVTGDQDKAFFLYDYDNAKSKNFILFLKNVLPNISSGTCFKKHQDFLVEQWAKQEASILFFYLPSTTDRCNAIIKFMDNVSLHPIDCLYEDFRQYSSTGEDFMPLDLESRDLKKRNKAIEIV